MYGITPGASLACGRLPPLPPPWAVMSRGPWKLLQGVVWVVKGGGPLAFVPGKKVLKNKKKKNVGFAGSWVGPEKIFRPPAVGLG